MAMRVRMVSASSSHVARAKDVDDDDDDVMQKRISTDRMESKRGR